MDIRSSLKKLPSVEKILGDDRVASRVSAGSRKGATRVVRELIARYREKIRASRGVGIDADELQEAIVAEVLEELDSLRRRAQRRVINATGVVLHTNLGRAVLSDETRVAIDGAAAGYSDLEIDLASGKRVDRGRRVARLLSLITGAEGALVVNNNAAAILLAVQTFAREGAVAISRGELVEIGGSFRLPEILASAAKDVIEVGTTNRTHLKDYERAIGAGATLLLKVHTSNYRIIGYTNDVPLRALAELGRRSRVPVMYDQGSGVLHPLQRAGIEGEECVEEVLASGVDLVSFSTDKVLGGPQGGALIGKARLIKRMKENHLSRALRLDKLTLAGLERVLLHYWEGTVDAVPAFKMITERVESVRARAERIAKRVGRLVPLGCAVGVEDSQSSIGGGSFPINPLPTAIVQITLAAGSADKIARALRATSPAVMVRVKGNGVIIDPRTVLENEEELLIEKLGEAFAIVLRRE
jgi:L-seryl-tRNA(Ser) seleniumtransferase